MHSNRNFAAQQSAMRLIQQHAVARANNRNFMAQQNLRSLTRSAVTEVVRELAQAQPTLADLELLTQVADDAETQELAPDEIEERLQGSGLAALLAVLAPDEATVTSRLMLLLTIITVYLMLNPPRAAESPPPPQVTVNMTVQPSPVNSDQIAEDVIKKLEEDGYRIVDRP